MDKKYWNLFEKEFDTAVRLDVNIEGYDNDESVRAFSRSSWLIANFPHFVDWFKKCYDVELTETNFKENITTRKFFKFIKYNNTRLRTVNKIKEKEARNLRKEAGIKEPWQLVQFLRREWKFIIPVIISIVALVVSFMEFNTKNSKSGFSSSKESQIDSAIEILNLRMDEVDTKVKAIGAFEETIDTTR